LSTKTSGWLRAAACVTALGLTLAGCAKKDNAGSGNTPNTGNNNPADQVGFPETQDAPEVPGHPGGTFHMGVTEPTAIDPYNSQESEGSLITHALFTGLSESTPDGKVVPAMADKWETNDDCSVWTFNLKKGWKFHNGEEVTSASFKRGWERTAAKAAASDVAYHMNQIKGFKEVNTGTATEMSGVDASDPAVLKVTLSDPSCEFYIRTVHTVFSPVPSTAGAADNKSFNDQPIGNGPFKMDGPWQHDKGIKLKRFDDYGGKKAYLDSVEITITSANTGTQEEYDGFNNGTFDWARLPTPVLSQARTANEPKGQWLSRKTSGINYILPMVTTKPLDSAKARQAISMAIDRAAIAKGVFQGAQVPATGLIPPGFKAAFQGQAACGSCKYDPDAAKKLATEAGLTPGTEINFQFNSGAGHEEWTAAIKQQLETNLGLKVKYGGVPFKDMLKNEQAPHASGIFRAAWGADYPTPDNFLEPLLSCASIGTEDPNQPAVGDDRGRYCNKDFDALLKKAVSTKDEGERNKIYQQAEKLAIDTDQALIPTWFRQQFRLINTQKFVNVGMNFFEEPTLSIISLK